MADENTTEVEVEETSETNEFETLAQELIDSPDGGNEADNALEPEESSVEGDESTGEHQDKENPEQTTAQPEPQPEPAAQPQPQPEPEPQPKTPEATSTSGDEETREQFLTRAATQFEAAYKLSDDEAELVGPEVASVLPKLAARMAMDIYGQVGRLMKSHVPDIVRSVTQQDLAANEYETTFFSKHKDLVEHKDTLVGIAKLYRQLNPDASPEVMMDEVAALARVKLKLPLTPQEQTPPPQQQKMIRNPPGVSPAPAGVIEQKNEFEQLADELLE